MDLGADADGSCQEAITEFWSHAAEASGWSYAELTEMSGEDCYVPSSQEWRSTSLVSVAEYGD